MYSMITAFFSKDSRNNCLLIHLRTWPGVVSCSYIKSILQNYPAVWCLQDFRLWPQVVSGFQWETVPMINNHKSYFWMNFSLYCNMRIILSSWKRHLQKSKTSMHRSVQANTGWFHVRELSAAIFFLSLCLLQSFQCVGTSTTQM